jgi:nucleoside-diphosphate-sugar epimerase
VLCDVRDAARLDLVFAAEKPDIVFHAAALKHVTLVENHPCEGVRTNVLGTRNVAAAAKACGAAHLALISTDKAVAPASVMGATKRVAEAVVRQHGGGGDMRVSIVRFGNVLGSAGSVVPIFQQPDRPRRPGDPDRRRGRTLLHDHPRGRAAGAARRGPVGRLRSPRGRRPDPGDGRAGQDHRPGPADDRAAGPGPAATSRSRSPACAPARS